MRSAILQIAVLGLFLIPSSLALVHGGEEPEPASNLTSIGGGRYLQPAEWTLVMGGNLEFRCPTSATPAIDPQNNVNVVRGQCPYRIIDEADLLGNPQIAVNPSNPNEVAWISLHGGPTEEGPTSRSRDPDPETPGSANAHTTFTSTDGGFNWDDNPHGMQGYGEDGDIVMDRDGNMVLASLFAIPKVRENGDRIFDYEVELYKENTAADRPGHRGHDIRARAIGNEIDEVSLTLVTPASFIETQEEYDSYHENASKRQDQRDRTPQPAGDADLGNYTISYDEGDHSNDYIAAVWHEKAMDYEAATTGLSSWINMAVTKASLQDDWHMVPDDQLIGPCMDASNAVAFNGRVYVACVIDNGYTGRRGAQIGEIDIWQYDPKDLTKRYVSTVHGMADGRPRLAADDEGRFAITSTRIAGEGHDTVTRTQLSFSWFGRNWEGINDIGGTLHAIWDQPAREARVTSLAVVDGLAYMSYMERSNTTVGTIDPVNGRTDTSAVEYHKAVAVFENCSPAPASLMDLNIGLARHPFQEGVVNDVTGAFDDQQDGMEVITNPDGTKDIYFVFGDFGVIQYGVFDAESVFGSVCPTIPLVTPIFTPVPPVPTPLLLSQGVGVGLGAAMALPGAVGLGSLLIAKRKAALAAAVKAR